MWADERGGDIPRHRCLSSGWGEIGLTPVTALTPSPWRTFTLSQLDTVFSLTLTFEFIFLICAR